MSLIFFACGEMMFRIFRGAPNPLANVTQKKTDHLFEPNSVMKNTSSIEGEFEYTANINHHGYRGEDFTVTKDPNTLRILVIGDSFTFGVGANDKETIPYQMQENLTKQGHRVEIINAGIGHTSPITHYLNLKNIHMKLKPDLVVMLFDLTDLWDDWHTHLGAIYGDDGEISHFDATFINGKRSWWRSAVIHSAFCKWINNKIVRTYNKMTELGLKTYIDNKLHGKKKTKAVIINSESTPNEIVMKHDGLIMMRGQKRKDLIMKHWDLSEKYLLKSKKLLTDNNIPLILVSYPHDIYVGPNEWEEGRKTWGFETNRTYTDHLPFEILENFTQKNQVSYIATLNAFLKIKDVNKTFFYNWDGHMTPIGYKTVADTISNHVIFQEALSTGIANK